jgi:hypothetical protein
MLIFITWGHQQANRLSPPPSPPPLTPDMVAVSFSIATRRTPIRSYKLTRTASRISVTSWTRERSSDTSHSSMSIGHGSRSIGRTARCRRCTESQLSIYISQHVCKIRSQNTAISKGQFPRYCSESTSVMWLHVCSICEVREHVMVISKLKQSWSVPTVVLSSVTRSLSMEGRSHLKLWWTIHNHCHYWVQLNWTIWEIISLYHFRMCMRMRSSQWGWPWWKQWLLSPPWNAMICWSWRSNLTISGESTMRW